MGWGPGSRRGAGAGALTLAGLLATPEAVASCAHAGAGGLRRGQAELGAVAVVDAAGVGALVVWGQVRGREKVLVALLGTAVSGSHPFTLDPVGVTTQPSSQVFCPVGPLALGC